MQDRFEDHLVKELDKYNGVAFPVKAGALQRLLITKLSPLKLHPNPDDEFSKPEIGPSYRIISEYEKAFMNFRGVDVSYYEEPIIVEKMHPEGYIIINGHHRWAAYYKLGIKSVPVKIMNLTHAEDIRKMLESASSDKRATFDLDEVVFCANEDEPSEKKPGFPFGGIFKERIHLGIPALFNYLSARGYDIWVYSSKFYSMDYIRSFLKRYHVSLTGIVTGIGRNGAQNAEARKEYDKLIAGKYKYTLHVDAGTVLKIDNRTKDFEEFPIDLEKTNWSQGVMDIVGGFTEK